MLILAQHVADKGAKRLHRDIEAGVEQPQQQSGAQQRRAERHATSAQAARTAPARK
jgi:hypothetical protein